MEVPAVDVNELKQAWLINAQATWNNPNKQLGRDLLVQLCRPGANVDAVAARVWYLDKLVKEAIVKAASDPHDVPFYVPR